MRPKIHTALASLMLNSTLIAAVFFNPELMELICGPFTLAPISKGVFMFIYIILLEVFKIFYSHLVNGLSIMKLSQSFTTLLQTSYTVKYLIILGFKILIVAYETQRKKYYIHSLLIQLSIIFSSIALDCFKKQNIAEVGQLLIIQNLHKLSIVYEVTRTFCPNLILYYFIISLLVFVISQIQTQITYGFKQSLYVKHDVYRFLVLSLTFFGLISITQLSNYGFKMLLIFLTTLKWFIDAISFYNSDKLNQSIKMMMIIAGIFPLMQILFIFIPFSSDTLYRIGIYQDSCEPL